MAIYCSRWPAARYPRPCIAEMGGKNPCIVTRHADLDRAAAGIVRSAYGMGGQKCSALSRLYVETDVADALIERLAAGDRRHPHRRSVRGARLAGPGRERARATATTRSYVAELRARRRADPSRAAAQLREGDLARGYYVAPDARRSAARSPAVAARDVPADPDGAPRARPRRGDAPRQRHRTWDSPPASTARRTRCRGSTTTSRRASPTPTARRARRPAPGRATSLSAAGRARARPARRSRPSTTSPHYLREQSRTVVEHEPMILASLTRAIVERHVRDGALRGARGLHAPDPVRGGPRDHPPAAPEPAPRAHDARPRLRPDDRHGLRAQAHVFLGRQSGRRLAAPPARCGRARLAGAARDRRAHARGHGGRLLRRRGAPAVRHAARLHRHRPRRRSIRAFARVQCPYTGEPLAAVPAINPDVTILHAQRADRAGNVALDGHRRRAARGGARRDEAAGHGRGDRRRAAARDELDRAAALGGDRRGASARAAPTLRTRRATTRGTTPSTRPGTASRANASRSRRGWSATCSAAATTADSSPACGRAA